MKPVWTTHAKARRKQMRVTEHRVERVIAAPDMSYSQTYGGATFTYYVGDGLCVPVDPDGAIVTVLWHGASGRDDDGQPRHQ